MDGPLKELGKLETLSSGRSKGTTIQGSLDSLLKSLREAKDEIAAKGVVDPSRLRDLSQVAEGKKKEIEDKQKEVYSSMSRFGKAWDKKFPTALPSYSDLFSSPSSAAALERTVALHLLRTGQFDVAETFLDESGVEIPPKLRGQFVELHEILKALRNQNIGPALDWADRYQEFLQSRGSPLVFFLHRSQYIRLLLSTHPPDPEAAIAYANKHLGPFHDEHEAELRRLMACIAYLPLSKLQRSPYQDLAQPQLHFDLEALFAKEYCATLGMSRQVPLRVVGDIGGGGALARIEKGKKVMKDRKSEWAQSDELPIELPLPPENRYHSIFACLVSKEQSTEINPPMMLECGHVISKDSLSKLNKSAGTTLARADFPVHFPLFHFTQIPAKPMTSNPPEGNGPLRRATRSLSIDPSKLVPMDKTEALRLPGHSDFNVLFIGAGNIMFGSPEGPWNHSFRLEHKLGPRLKVVGLIDPNTQRAAEALEKKRGSFVVAAYQATHICKTLDDFIRVMSPEEKPHAVIVGSPPMFRGILQKGRDIEAQILERFPGVPLFVEKPITTGPLEELSETHQLAKRISDSKTICSVGYMLRYLKAVQTMKKILEDNKLTVMCTIARYACAYEAIAKPDWWDKSKRHALLFLRYCAVISCRLIISAGPIIEQGTHFCDLSRYFGGEVDISTVEAHSLEWDENAGHLSKLTIDESQIAPENRIPRVTSATWKYESGAVGSLSHVVALQGTLYSCELEVFADGYQLKLVNPYSTPVLYIRRPGDDNETSITFTDDDPFFSEISHFIDTIEGREENEPRILSSFDGLHVPSPAKHHR
ncbi:hypothetical protein EST38_g1732 [Candolleomyces aberdarensis]|uniref:LisH domain-containing protein n=1 Tax=Candolleomyces aberdarensis TaxID=2316362 RepID=A0A4Q2DXY6_9AGAR|nr:hypothetical protein EST38_g1732 [Candolleomyces aberdarensis]